MSTISDNTLPSEPLKKSSYMIAAFASGIIITRIETRHLMGHSKKEKLQKNNLKIKIKIR